MLRPNDEYEPVREGALLRIAADLLVPFGELGRFDRYELLDWLAPFGIEPATSAGGGGWFWIEGACPGPEPTDEVTILRPDDANEAAAEDGGWVIGQWERGTFDVRHRFGHEGDACRWLLHEVIAHHVTSMGTAEVPPYVTDRTRAALLAALAEVTALVRDRRPPQP